MKTVHGLILKDNQNISKNMGTLLFSQANNNLRTNEMKTEYQAKCQLNNNLDDANTIKQSQSESKQIQKRKCQCGKIKTIFFLTH